MKKKLVDKKNRATLPNLGENRNNSEFRQLVNCWVHDRISYEELIKKYRLQDTTPIARIFSEFVEK
jgi:hypothetical protein